MSNRSATDWRGEGKEVLPKREVLSGRFCRWVAGKYVANCRKGTCGALDVKYW